MECLTSKYAAMKLLSFYFGSQRRGIFRLAHAGNIAKHLSFLLFTVAVFHLNGAIILVPLTLNLFAVIESYPVANAETQHTCARLDQCRQKNLKIHRVTIFRLSYDFRAKLERY